MSNYEFPMAKVVCFETIDIITASALNPDDTPEKLSTWGKGISEFNSVDFDLFG